MTQRRAPGVPHRRRRGFTAGDQNSGGAHRTSPEKCHRGTFRARSGSFGRRRSGASNYDLSSGGGGLQRRGRRAGRMAGAGVGGDRATGLGESSGRVRWAPGNPRSTMRRSAACEGDHVHGAELVDGNALGRWRIRRCRARVSVRRGPMSSWRSHASDGGSGRLRGGTDGSGARGHGRTSGGHGRLHREALSSCSCSASSEQAVAMAASSS